jgi:phosphohistidine phosphatase SixA
MKLVYILRHAEKNLLTGGITKKGKEDCEKLKKELPQFNMVISSDKKRAVETARALTGKEPDQDARANIEWTTGTELVNLITETVQNIRDGEKALIITHSPCIPAARRLLKPNEEVPEYHPLTGFIVNEKLEVRDFMV